MLGATAHGTRCHPGSITVPEPDRDAGSRTMLCIIRALLQTGIVVKFWPQIYASVQAYRGVTADRRKSCGEKKPAFRGWLAEERRRS